MSKKRLTREESQQKTRLKLLKVAAKMFAKQGFYETSIDQIAESAGYSKGAVYSNFNSKSDLFIAVFENQQQEEIKQLKSIIDSCNSIDQFIELFEANHAQGRELEKEGSILKLEFLLHALRHEKARSHLERILNENRHQVEKILQYLAVKNNMDYPLEAKSLAYLILSLDIGFGIQSFILDEQYTDVSFVKGLELLLKRSYG